MRDQMGKRVIDDKSVEVKLKAGYTTEEFCKYFELEENELLPVLEKQFPKRYCRYIMAKLDGNKNKAVAKNAAKKARKEIAEKEPSAAVLVTRGSLKDENLSKLEIRRASLKAELLKLEKSITLLGSDEKALEGELRACRQKFEALTEEFEKLSLHTEKISQSLSETRAKKSSLREEVNSKSEILTSLEEEIKQLKKVQIFFYQDGTIEADDIKVELTEDKIYAKYMELISNKTLENCTVKKIRQLAMLQTFVSGLNKDYDIVFEEKEIEELYKNLL